MQNNIRIIQDISLLYELSLSVGSSLDPRENCLHFLRTLISRKSLNFGSVWLHRDKDVCDLFLVHPHFREAQKSVTCSHYILKELKQKPYISIHSEAPHFDDLLHEKKVEKGSYAIFRLGDLGFLKLFASNRLNGFSEVEMAQLKQVVDKLNISLDGCFAHIHLKEETESRMIAQKALEESENMLRRIIDSSLDAVVSVDDNGKTVEWNTQAEKMFGYTRQEALGKDLNEMIIPERHRLLYRQSLQDKVRLSAIAHVNDRFEIKCMRKNGSEFLAELSMTADKDNKNILFVGFIRDITEQKKAKLEIEQTRIRMETLITNLQTGILLEDSDRKIALVNKSFCDLFCIPVEPEQLIGQDCSQSAEQAKHLFADPEVFVTSINRAVNDRKLVENEVFVMTDGKVLERNFIPLFSQNKYEGHLWQYRDITERQNAQQAILESEEKFRGVLENMELGLLEVDLDENILRANNAFCQMLGYQQEELLGKNASKIFLTEAAQKEMERRREERKKGQSGVYEIQMKQKNGEPIWALISGAPVKNGKGQVVGSMGIQFDLTERKKLENELAEAKHVADRARFAERQFLTHMSHEIRTPINAVIGMTHLLYETQPDSTQKDYLNSLRFSADSLLGIIDNILDLSRIDAGELEFEQKPFDLNYLLKSLLNTFQFKIEEKDIQIFENIDPAIENMVVGDPTRTNQILTNLMGNALKFTEKGIISLTAKLLEKTDGHYLLEFRVHDTGIGIPEDKHDTIFEYFKQADVHINRKYGGTGLGLTIVKQLIEMQGGSIRLESREGVGSDFIVTLRFGDSGIPVSEHALHYSNDYVLRDKRINGLHVLIVEDNLLNQKLISKTIQTWKCTFAVANNGLEALSKTAEQRFDVILMDIHMPLMDGCETTLAIRTDKNNPNMNVPIIALTAAAMSDEKRQAFEVGMNDFLTKPISPKALQEHILRVLEKHPLDERNNAPLAEGSDIAADAQVDLNYLLELSSGDKQFVADILEAFLVEIPVNLDNLEACANQSNWLEVGRIIHKMKPNLAMLGMKTLHENVLLIEDLIKHGQGDSPQCAKMVSQLTSKTKEVLHTVAQLKSTMVS